MEKDSYYFRVGLFMLLIVMGGIYAIGWFAANQDKNHYIRYAIYFKGSVNGLSVGSPVRLKGIDVGTVKEIGFDSYENDLIKVLVDIVDTAPIRSDTIASMQIQGITGTSMVSLDNEGSKEKEYLVKKDNDDHIVIQSRPSTLEQLFADVPTVLANINSLSNQAGKLMSDENIDNINSTLKSVSYAANNFANTFGGRNNKSLNQSMKSLNKTMDEIQKMVVEGKLALREIRMLSKTLREDPSILIRGNKHDGKKL